MSSVRKSHVQYPSDREILFTRVVAAPRELVWAAWTDPEQVVRWWGPEGFNVTNHAMDVRPGGQWRFTMHGPDGADYPNLITYHEVRAPARLVYDHGDDAKPKWFSVTVDFLLEGANTRLVMHMTCPNAADCEDAKKFGIDGHHSTMTRLDAHVLAAAEGHREIVLSRIFAAPRELVWQAMTDPHHVTHWWGPRGFTSQTESHDFRVGGIWKHVMIGPDGTRYPNQSTFQEIVPLERVVYKHGGRREDGPGTTFIATWTFEPAGPQRTRLTMKLHFPSADARELVVREFGAIEGGRQTLARLAEYLPGMRIAVAFSSP